MTISQGGLLGIRFLSIHPSYLSLQDLILNQ